VVSKCERGVRLVTYVRGSSQHTLLCGNYMSVAMAEHTRSRSKGHSKSRGHSQDLKSIYRFMLNDLTQGNVLPWILFH
jgi:hypothetical protein